MIKTQSHQLFPLLDGKLSITRFSPRILSPEFAPTQYPGGTEPADGTPVATQVWIKHSRPTHSASKTNTFLHLSLRPRTQRPRPRSEQRVLSLKASSVRGFRAEATVGACPRAAQSSREGAPGSLGPTRPGPGPPHHRGSQGASCPIYRVVPLRSQESIKPAGLSSECTQSRFRTLCLLGQVESHTCL